MRHLLRAAAGLCLLALPFVACKKPPRAGDLPPPPAAEPGTAAPPADAPHGPPARAFRIEASDRLLRGPLADGRLGDVRLENDRAAFVIQAIGGPFGFAAGGGNLIDAAALPGGHDELAQVYLYLDDRFPRQAVYQELSIGEGDRPGSAAARARGRDSLDPLIEIETTYLLRPGVAALEILTVVRNRGPRPVAGFEIGDAVAWGRAFPGREGGSTCPPGGGEVPALAAVGETGAYAYLGARPVFRCRGVWGAADTILDTLDLPAGAADGAGVSRSVRRWLAVGDRADTSSATAAAREARGDAQGRAAFRSLGTDGEAVADALLTVTGIGDGQAETVRTDSSGRARVLLPPGSARAVGVTPGRSGAGSARLAVPTETPVDVTLSAAGRLDLDIEVADVEQGPSVRAPVRVTVRGTGSTPDPDFGGPFSAGGFGPSFVAVDGQGHHPVPPGTYQVQVTRGPEYDLLSEAVTVPAGGSAPVHGVLVRRVETGGQLAADLHVHTTGSTDSGVSPRDRLLSCAAEGIELVVASDHNRATDLRPQVEALGLERWIAAAPGVEVTTDLSAVPVGHLNVFPVPVDPASPAPLDPVPWKDRGFAELLAGARSLEGVLVQVNHPRSPDNGAFALLGIPPDDWSGAGADAARVDLIEVANGLGFERTAAAVADWSALVSCGVRVVPTGGSDSHALLDQTCGWPRTWVFAGRDDPAGMTPERMAAAVRTGRVVVSTGPLVVLRVDDVPAGGRVNAQARGVLLQVRVEAAPWIDVKRIRVLVNGAEARSWAPTALGAEPVRLEVQEALAIAGDAVVWAEAWGEAPLPVLSADSPIRPWAITGPVWVDADGDGEVHPAGGIVRCPPWPDAPAEIPAAPLP